MLSTTTLLLHRTASSLLTKTTTTPKFIFSRYVTSSAALTENIPGWELIHSPPKDKSHIPRGSLVGTVVSTKMDKTVNVAVVRHRIVPKYRKRVKYTRKFFAHDEEETCNDGDLVMIAPCKKMSKKKHFVLHEVLKAKPQL